MRSQAPRAPRLAAAALGLLLLLAPSASQARDREEEPSAAYTALTGIGATLCTLVYTPLKVVYAAGGTVLSGIAWAWTLGDTEVAGPIVRRSVRGDYVVTPRHLEGRDRLEFVGPRY